MFQGYLTDYTLNTAFESGFQTGNTLDITYLIQHYLNYTITSDQLGVLIPEVLTKYGSGKTVEIAGSFSQAPMVSHFTATGQTVEGSLATIIKVDGEEAIVAEFDSISFDGVITSKDGSVFGSISKSSIGTIGSKFSTTLGLTAAQLNTELQSEVDTQITEVNKELAAGIPVPEIHGIDLSDFELDFFDGYLEFGMSVDAQFWDYVFTQSPMVVQEQ